MTDREERFQTALNLAWTMLQKIEHGGSYSTRQWHDLKHEILALAQDEVAIVPRAWADEKAA